jgi:hypothetical protein
MEILALGAGILNVDLIEIDFDVRSDIVGVPYSSINIDLPSNNRFHLQESVVKANHVWKSICSDFTPNFSYLKIFSKGPLVYNNGSQTSPFHGTRGHDVTVRGTLENWTFHAIIRSRKNMPMSGRKYSITS